MPLRKSKNYSRFNVGTMMKARKEMRERVALSHISLQEAKSELDAVDAKKRRLDKRVKSCF